MPRYLILLLTVALAAAACGSDGDDGSTADSTAAPSTTAASTTVSSTTAPDTSSTTAATSTSTSTGDTTTTSAPADEVLRIVLGNDDGVGAPGIDALAMGLSTLDDVEVVIVAPADERSGSAGTTTDGPVEATDATTASGLAATAVDGFPADAVIWALDNIDPGPHVVLTGSNSAQNIGPLQELSGTVGAARQAAQLGVPAVAVSQGLADPIDFAASVDAAVEWVDTHRDQYFAGEVTLFSINAPTCPEGTQGVVEVPWGPEWNDRGGDVDCESDLDDLTDDIDAFLNGYTSISELAING